MEKTKTNDRQYSAPEAELIFIGLEQTVLSNVRGNDIDGASSSNWGDF